MKNSTVVPGKNFLSAEALKIVYGLALCALAVFAVVSIVKGFQNALINSQDFQWSPARLLLDRVNPYQVSLQGNPDGALILTQEPNYLHFLYILFLPLGLLDWAAAKPVWATVNFTLGLACVYLIAYSGSKISGARLIAILFLFLCSTPFRNTLSNGQQGLWILFFAYLGWATRSKITSAPLFCISYVKYSFAPPTVFWLLLEKKFRLILASMLVLGASWILFSLMVETSPLLTLFQPLQVSAKGVGIGTADIMSLGKVFEFDRYLFRGAGYVFGLVLAASLTLYLKLFCKQLEDQDIFAALGLISLMSFIHLGYEFVFLLPVLCRSFHLGAWRRAVVWIGVGYFWFMLRFFMTGDAHYSLLAPINFVILASMFFAFTFFGARQTTRIRSQVPAM